MTIESSHKAIHGGALLDSLKIIAAQNGFLMEEDSEGSRDTDYPAENWENGDWSIWYKENTRHKYASAQVGGPIDEADFFLAIQYIPLHAKIPMEILWAIDRMPKPNKHKHSHTKALSPNQHHGADPPYTLGSVDCILRNPNP